MNEVEPEKRLELIESRVVDAANQLILEHPDVEAIVLECTNLPPLRGCCTECYGASNL